MAVAEADTKTDFEKLKDAFKNLSLSDVRPIVLASISTIRDAGEYTEAIGQLEKSHKESYDILSELSEKQPETLLLSFIDKIPEDKLKILVELSLKMATAQSQLKDFKNLTADQKIKLGSELKELAMRLAKIVGDLP